MIKPKSVIMMIDHDSDIIVNDEVVMMIRNMMKISNKQKSEPIRLSPGLRIPEGLCSLQSIQPANKKRRLFAKTLFFCNFTIIL